MTGFACTVDSTGQRNCKGIVTNIQTDKNVTDVSPVVHWTGGTDSDFGSIDINPILPGQSSPFVVSTIHPNPQLNDYSIGFKKLFGKEDEYPVEPIGPVSTQPTVGAKRKMYSSRPPMTIDKSKKYFATIKMDIGDIRLELYPNEAPETVNSFVFLARDGFFDGLTFHRVIAGFVAQGGDPTGTGRGGPGYQLPDEHNSHKFLDGSMGMATSGPNTAGSQFFIDFAPQPNLDGGYTVFGQIVSGRDVLDKIAKRDPSTATTPGTKINTIVIEEQ